MLVAKINPSASFAKQENPFSATTVTADSITVLARPYLLGANEVNFEVVFGNVTPAVEAAEGVEAKSAQFQQVANHMVVLTKEELASWGTDDAVAMEAVAAKLGTTVVSTELL